MVHGGAPLTAARRELWCLAHAMTVAAAAVTLWHRAHLYKALACIVLALIAVQYLLSGGVLDRRSIETIFTINATRYADRSYRTHPRGLIIYGPATAVPNLTGGGNVSSTTILSILAKGLSNYPDSSPCRPEIWSAAVEQRENFRCRTRLIARRCHDVPSSHQIWLDRCSSVSHRHRCLRWRGHSWR